MSSKKIVFDRTARKALQQGVDALGNVVRVGAEVDRLPVGIVEAVSPAVEAAFDVIRRLGRRTEPELVEIDVGVVDVPAVHHGRRLEDLAGGLVRQFRGVTAQELASEVSLATATRFDCLRPPPLLSAQEGAHEFALYGGHEAADVRRVEHLLYIAEYKRRQAPPGVKITSRNFGRDRRYPIASGF